MKPRDCIWWAVWGVSITLMMLSACQAACGDGKVPWKGYCWPPYAPVLPTPPEYDKPYTGRVVINIARDMDEMAELCSPNPLASVALGCAFRYSDANTGLPRVCYIYIAPDSYIRTQYGGRATREDVIRHEMAHCNGWPGTHPR
jgi:hypothetical protein